MMIKLAGVVTLYNPDEEVKNNIKTYLKQLDKLYVIDNTENRANKNILPRSKKIQYIPNYENLGVATALNIGANMAREEGYGWLLTMDQDSRFNECQLEKMITFLENTSIERIGLISPWHNIKTGAIRPSQSIEEVIEVMTSGNIINLRANEEVGGFKDWLFIDSIDIEYGMNLNKNNYKVIRLNDIELEHELGDIEIKHILGRNFVCSNHNYIRRYYIVRNINYVYDMYHAEFPEYCNFIKNGLKGAFRNVVIFEKDKYRKIRNMFRGYRDYKKGIQGKYPYSN